MVRQVKKTEPFKKQFTKKSWLNMLSVTILLQNQGKNALVKIYF